jgi:tetratricopeptide (TPR) repeat protein
MRGKLQRWVKVGGVALLLVACAPTLSAYQEGMGALERGDDTAASEHFEAALDDPADASRALSQLEDMEMARAQELERDQPKEAMAIYRRMLTRNPDAHRVRMRLGKMLVNDGQVDVAADILAANPKCSACGPQLGSMLASRGRERLRASEWELARTDLQAAAKILPSADVYLDIAQLFTLGGSGSSRQASEAMVAAYPLLGGDAVTQERWAAVREDVVRACIRGGDFQGADLALEPEDPRVQESDQERAKARVLLRLEIVDALKGAGKVDDALGRVDVLWQAIEQLGLSGDPSLRARVLDVYARGVASALAAGDGTRAASTLRRGMGIDPQHATLRLQAAIMAVSIDPKRAQEALDGIASKSGLWKRAQALVLTEQAFESIERRSLQDAERLLDRATEIYPDALEVHLAWASWAAAAPLEDLSRRDLKRLEKEGKVGYAGAPTQLARATAELAWVESRWARPSAKTEALRLPAFSERLAAAKAKLSGAYPFETRLVDGDAPQLVVINQSGKIVTVDVVGAGVDEAVELDPEADYTYEFEEAGVAKVEGPAGSFYLALESGVAITFNP